MLVWSPATKVPPPCFMLKRMRGKEALYWAALLTSGWLQHDKWELAALTRALNLPRHRLQKAAAVLGYSHPFWQILKQGATNSASLRLKSWVRYRHELWPTEARVMRNRYGILNRGAEPEPARVSSRLSRESLN